MPITSDQFERMDDDGEGGGPTPGTNGAAILHFLRAHPDEAFTQSEIADATDVTAGSVGPTLVRLRERGRVDHRSKYWRVSDHDRSTDASVDQAAAAMAARESEGETPRMAAWQAHAVDPRDHRNE